MHDIVSLRNARIEPHVLDRTKEISTNAIGEMSQQRDRYTFVLLIPPNDLDVESFTSLPTLPEEMLGEKGGEGGGGSCTSSSRTPPKYRRLVFATSTEEQKANWLADIARAIAICDKDQPDVMSIASMC